MVEVSPEFSNSASSSEDMLARFGSSSKCSFNHPTISPFESASTAYPLLSRLMVCQNLHEANRKCFSIASPKSSYTMVLGPKPTQPQPFWCPSVASGDTWAIHAQKDSFFRLTASVGSQVATTTGIYDLLTKTLNSCFHDRGPEHGPLGFHGPSIPRDALEVLPEVGFEDQSDRGLSRAFPSPHYTFGLTRYVR